MPPRESPIWSEIITSNSDLAGVSLGTRILVARMREEVKANRSLLSAKMAQLYTYVASTTSAQADVAKF